MKIAGFVKNSFVDFPNKISSVIFTKGCNFNCWYCHNKHIIGNETQQLIDEKEVFEFLNKRKNLIDAVVISGGEPTLQIDLKDFIIKIKKMGFCVKLDTNGSNPHIVEDLLNCNLLDYIAMDIKTSLQNYDKVCGIKVNIENIKKTIEIIMNSNIDYEFRTTIAPEIQQEDIDDILQIIKNSKNYYLQKCNIPNGYPLIISNNKSKAEKFLEKSKKYTINTALRGFE